MDGWMDEWRVVVVVVVVVIVVAALNLSQSWRCCWWSALAKVDAFPPNVDDMS